MKKIKESTLRKILINRVLDFPPEKLLRVLISSRIGEYTRDEIDWDIQDGRRKITKPWVD